MEAFKLEDRDCILTLRHMGYKKPNVGMNTYRLLSQICIRKFPVAQQRSDSSTAPGHKVTDIDEEEDKATFLSAFPLHKYVCR